jgi:hypothetical protein
MKYQEYLAPCSHAIACIQSIGQDPYKYFYVLEIQQYECSPRDYARVGTCHKCYWEILHSMQY